jgi:hypothetical protein
LFLLSNEESILYCPGSIEEEFRFYILDLGPTPKDELLLENVDGLS